MAFDPACPRCIDYVDLLAERDAVQQAATQAGRELAETKALLEAAAAELDCRDTHLGALRGLLRELRAYHAGHDWTPSFTARIDAAQSLPPASEPPGADRLGMPVIDLPERATREQLVEDIRALRGERRTLTAAKAALEAARDNAVRERDKARADRTRALALATEHLEAKAALEVQLRDERASHAATEDWRLKLMDAWERVCQAAQVDPDSTTDHVVAVVAILLSGHAHATSNEQALTALIGPLRQRALERDALAAQLAGVGRVLESIQAHAERTLGATTAEKDRALDWICGQAKGARAALAASGPGEGE